MRTDKVYELIGTERIFQEAAVQEGRYHDSIASGNMSALLKVAILLEACGDVARKVIADGKLMKPGDNKHLKLALTKVAAVAVAWMESLQ